MHFDEEQIENLNKIYRINLINSCSGYKAANLIGTVSDKGDKNLAIFSSIVHLGSNPPLLGFFLRPTEIVPRHTYLNIKENSYYTINSVQEKFADKAHHTSAKYDRNISEFNVAEIESENINNFPAPFVKSSSIKIGMKFVEELKINYNKSRLIVGKIVQLNVDENLLTEDGFINLNDAKIATISGCDGYSFPDEIVQSIESVKSQVEYIFFLPSKFSVYSSMINNNPYPILPNVGWQALQSLGAKLGIATVNLTEPMVAKSRKLLKEKNEMMFWEDDAHWNANGAEFAADLVCKTVTDLGCTIPRVP